MAKKNKIAANLAREIWRSQGFCESCGKTKEEVQLQGAHIMGVGTAIRISAELRNGYSLCSYEHRWFHDHPHEFVEWVETTWAKEYLQDLREMARPGQGQKIDWDAKIQWLKEVKQAIEEKKLTVGEARILESKVLP